MPQPSLFQICTPREDVLKGSIAESDFAADLAQVLRGDAPAEYLNPALFFANTYPTRGLKDLLKNVCLRLNGSRDQVASIFRLDTNYGGGKTHALIALAHAVRGRVGGADLAEFIDPKILPVGRVRIAAFDGENADPTNGHLLEDGLRAFTPWGEIAHALAGKQGYEIVRRSDENGAAPGAGNLKELFKGGPVLILLDELSVYLRKLKARERERAGGQITAFLTALFKAVESTPNAAVVFTLAIGKGGLATDAYTVENKFIAETMTELEKVSGRKATLLNPTKEDETVRVLRRRLFSRIDETVATQVIDAYGKLWRDHQKNLPSFGASDKRIEAFRHGFPLHPELIETLTTKTSTLSNFQRVRGMLRLLARAVSLLWKQQPGDAYAIHLHHLDPAFEPIRQEIVTRMEQGQLVPAIKADVAAVEGGQRALAQEMDATCYSGQPPYGSYVARSVLFHTLAFNEGLKGASREQIRYAILSPGTDISFVDDAVLRLIQTSAYLDDRPQAPLRFLTEANLTQMVRQQEQQVDPSEERAQLNDRIKGIFGGNTFNLLPFPGGPYEVPDEAGDGKPFLVVIGYDAAEISSDGVVVPDLVSRIYRHRGTGNDFRKNRNNVVFLVVDSGRKEEMKLKMRRRLALDALRQPERLNDLAEHQRDKVKEQFRRSDQEVAIAIQQAYRHVFYPNRTRVEGSDLDLDHTAIDAPNAAANPGDGQKQVIRILRENNKLRLPEDNPDTPTYIRDRTPLRSGRITTAALRSEFRRNPALPILIGDDIFVKGIRQGVEQGEYVYQSGDLLWGKGDPWATVKIDEQSFVYTAAHARENEIWPRNPEPIAPQLPPSRPAGVGEEERDYGRVTGTPAPVSPPPNQPLPDTKVSAEGVLKEALTKLWETARSRRFRKIISLQVKIYEPSDGFKMLGVIGSIPRASSRVKIDGSYETTKGGELHLEFGGSVDDAGPVKEFLDQQLRAAREKNVSVEFTVTFPDGLPLTGEEAEGLTQRLTRFGTGAAYVSATAEGSS